MLRKPLALFLVSWALAQAQSPRPFITDLVQGCSINGRYLARQCYIFHIMGRRAGFTSNSALNDVKEFANSTALIPTYTSADALEVISSSAADDGDPAGTGAQTVKVTYIDASNNLVESANITLNGTTAVAAGFSANKVLWMEVTAVGSGETAAGNIRLRLVAGSVEIEQISAGGNHSLSAQFMVPAGYTGYVIHWDGSAVNNDQDLRLRATVATFSRALQGPYIFQDMMYIPSNQIASAQQEFVKLPALTRIKVSTVSAGTAGTVRAATSFVVAIIKD